jgi:hypothetical protein
MATRYLQTQHRNKQGKTSGDGRSIWNGYLKSDNLTFDISSRGTGATILSPGAQEAEGFWRPAIRLTAIRQVSRISTRCSAAP